MVFGLFSRLWLLYGELFWLIGVLYVQIQRHTGFRGGIDFNTNASVIKLSQFEFREKEKFLYEYDLSANPVMGVWRCWWRHQIRVEAIQTPNQNQTYPFCIGGKGICPPEDCGGAWGFMNFKDEFSLLDVLDFVTSILEDENAEIDRELIRRKIYPSLMQLKD